VRPPRLSPVGDPVLEPILMEPVRTADLVSLSHALCYVLCKLRRLLQVGGRERAVVQRRVRRQAHAFCPTPACRGGMRCHTRCGLALGSVAGAFGVGGG